MTNLGIISSCLLFLFHNRTRVMVSVLKLTSTSGSFLILEFDPVKYSCLVNFTGIDDVSKQNFIVMVIPDMLNEKMKFLCKTCIICEF